MADRKAWNEKVLFSSEFSRRTMRSCNWSNNMELKNGLLLLKKCRRFLTFMDVLVSNVERDITITSIQTLIKIHGLMLKKKLYL